MKLSYSLVLVASGLRVAANAATISNDLDGRNLGQELCRCEADWENFYKRRLEDATEEHPRQRELYHHYDYTDTYLEDGYYVIEGVKVIPRSHCNRFNFFGRTLEEESESQTSFVAEQDVKSIAAPESSHFDDVNAADQETSARDLTYYYGSKGTQIFCYLNPIGFAVL